MWALVMGVMVISILHGIQYDYKISQYTGKLSLLRHQVYNTRHKQYNAEMEDSQVEIQAHLSLSGLSKVHVLE